MSLQRLAGVALCIVSTSSVATGQTRSEPTGQAPATNVVERTYAGGAAEPWRRVQTRSASGNREVVVDSAQAPNIDGKWAPVQETVSETIRTAPNAQQTRQDVFGFAGDGRRRLLETTQSVQNTLPNGDISAEHNTWAPELNDRLELRTRQIEQTRSSRPDLRQTDTTLLVPHHNEPLRETERTAYTEQRVSPEVVRYDGTHQVRDLNGRWQAIETQTGETRDVGAAGRVEEQIVQRPDLNGKLAVEERTVTRRSTVNAQEDVVIETYAPSADRLLRADGGLALSQRVHRTTTATADGGRDTVEEVEGRSHAAPTEPMRLIRRTVTTVRQVAASRWVTERQVFERDVNGRMSLVATETEDGVGK